jgi:hypothetical protein
MKVDHKILHTCIFKVPRKIVQNGNQTNYREREKCKQTQGIMQCEPTEQRGREAERRVIRRSNQV